MSVLTRAGSVGPRILKAWSKIHTGGVRQVNHDACRVNHSLSHVWVQKKVVDAAAGDSAGAPL